MTSKVNESQPVKIQKSWYCGSCNLQFSIKDCTFKDSRYPLLLLCGHSTCKNCLLKSLKSSKCIKCQQCDFTFTSNSADLDSECFPFSLYLLGNLVAVQSPRLMKEKRLAFLSSWNFDYEVKGESSLKNLETSGSLCEECSLTAFWYCENCRSNFCEICWSKVHSSAKSLMKHFRTSINNVKTTKYSLKKCSEHENEDLEFYCKGCSTSICSHCFILKHQGEGHCPITLKEKNKEVINILKTAAEKAEKMVKRMRTALEQLKLAQISTDNSHVHDKNLITELESQITSNFSRLHGLLQLEEGRLIRKLYENSNQRENNMKALRLQLEKQINDVENLLHEYESVVKKSHNGNLVDLNRELENVQHLPCFLITKQSSEKEAKATFDERLVDSLRSYCTLDLPSYETFELLSSSNLPEDYTVENLHVSSDTEQKSPESNASDNDTLSNCSEQDLPQKRRRETKIFYEKKNYSVRVSYIKNPGEFYVMLNSQRTSHQEINKKASLAGSLPAVSGAVAKDEIYLVKYTVDNKWYRGRVIEIIPSKKVEVEVCVAIYYIDYGNSEIVPISRLRPISPDMLEHPPLAVKCKLYDCISKEGEWCVESTKTMEKILKNYSATMFVHKVQADCLEVDLRVAYPEGEIGREIVSVREALLFLEFSSLVRGPKFPRFATASHYLQQNLPSKGDEFDVVVTHVNSLRDFYIQRTWPDCTDLYKLTIDLQKYYSENSEKGMIYNPLIGSPCAALFPADQEWYRAKIIGIKGKKMVNVFYVDYGNTEIVPWTSIRKLRECFVKRPPLAIQCELAEISGAGGRWNERTFSYLKNCIMTNGCRVQVQDCCRSKQRLKVLLYKETNKNEVCVNGLFRDKGLTLKNESSLRKSKFQKEVEEECVTEKFSTQKGPTTSEDDEDDDADNGGVNDDYDQMSSGAEDNSQRNDKVNKKRLSAKKLREQHEFEKKDGDEVSLVGDVDSEADKNENNIFKVEVEILSAESPSCIYVTFPDLMVEYKTLQSKLNEFYKGSTPFAKEWTTDSVCAAFDSSKGCWFRASILSILPENQIKVFLKDVAQVCTVPVSAIRELDPSFTKFATCAVKCHLANIRSPGEHWPGISSEYLLSELENYKEIYMTKKGNIESKSLPVELWVKKIVPRGALEPSTKEWITLNKLLVNQGLAVPVTQKVPCTSIQSNEEECSEKTKESDHEDLVHKAEIAPRDEEEKKNSDIFIPSPDHRWLPPEPIKKSRFIGIPTYVDYNACIYIYDVQKDEKDLNMIREVLRSEYDNSKPEPEDHFWSEGQLCIARYHMDKYWYRGQIIKINDDLTYDVLFVDYGNVETCQVTDLRKRIKMIDIPVFGRKFQLWNVRPVSEDDKWPISVIDFLHSLVVDNKCEVDVVKPASDPSESNYVYLKIISSNVDVNTFLIKHSFVVPNFTTSNDSDDDKEVLPCKEDFCESPKPSDDFVHPKFCVPLNIPDECCDFFIEITQIISDTEFYAKFIDDVSLPSCLKSVLNDFESLQKTLMEEGNLQPLVDKFVKDYPCCCVHPKSKVWCRGEMENFLKDYNLVSVFFVDYGNKASVRKDLIYECKNEWLTFPRMALKCRLANIEKRAKESNNANRKALRKYLNQTPLFAKVLKRDEDVLIVTLMTEKTGQL